MRRFIGLLAVSVGAAAAGLWSGADSTRVPAELAATTLAESATVATGATGAWSFDGHRIVCLIAWWEMRRETRLAVGGLLRADRARASFPEACVWPDRIWSLIEEGVGDYERYVPYSRAHYMNSPPGAASVDVAHCTVRLESGEFSPCIVDAIAEFSDSLVASSSPLRRAEALKWLGHLVADIHQPLHSGYAEDRGGNDVLVNVMGEPERNLHSVWDGFFIDHRDLPWRQYATQLGAEIRPIDRTLWAQDDPIAWANESFQITEGDVYDLVEEEPYVGQLYFDRHILTVERRLKQAAYRLARLLDRLLAP